MKALSLLLITIVIITLLDPSDGAKRRHHVRVHKKRPDIYAKKPISKYWKQGRRMTEPTELFLLSNAADEIHVKILKKKQKKMRQATLNPDLITKRRLKKYELVHSMENNYYFIQSCCMDTMPINQACKKSLDRFSLVCKEHVGAHPGECKKRASELYYNYCKKDGNRNDGPMYGYVNLKGRRFPLAGGVRQEMLHPVSIAVPLEVPKGPHRVLW